MKIIRNEEDVIRNFDELEVGTVFIDDGNDVCIKTDADDQEYNSVRLYDGVIFRTYDKIHCKVVKATLTIEKEVERNER